MSPRMKLPWWQVSKTPRSAFVLGSLALLICVATLVRVLAKGEWLVFDVLYLTGAVLLALVFFASGIAQVKRDSAPSRDNLAGDA